MRAELKAWWLAIAMTAVKALLPPLSLRRFRSLVLRICGFDFAIGTEICGGTTITGWGLMIEKGSYVGPSCFFEINTGSTVKIGQSVSIGPHCTFITSTHAIGNREKRAGKSESRDIVVEAGSWIGAGVTLLPGSTVRAGTVVAAGSVVSGHTASNTLVAGVPARTVRELGA